MDQIRVLLVGGPVALSEVDRVHEVSALVDKVKLVHGGGYEHFKYSGETRSLNGRELPVFHWCDRTKMAE